MRSSGVYRTTVAREVECFKDRTATGESGGLPWRVEWLCTFAGEVDVILDPEVQSAGWYCPECGDYTELDWEDFDDE